MNDQQIEQFGHMYFNSQNEKNLSILPINLGRVS